MKGGLIEEQISQLLRLIGHVDNSATIPANRLQRFGADMNHKRRPTEHIVAVGNDVDFDAGLGGAVETEPMGDDERVLDVGSQVVDNAHRSQSQKVVLSLPDDLLQNRLFLVAACLRYRVAVVSLRAGQISSAVDT